MLWFMTKNIKCSNSVKNIFFLQKKFLYTVPIQPYRISSIRTEQPDNQENPCPVGAVLCTILITLRFYLGFRWLLLNVGHHYTRATVRVLVLTVGKFLAHCHSTVSYSGDGKENTSIHRKICFSSTLLKQLDFLSEEKNVSD